jgi:hypothetical protein
MPLWKKPDNPDKPEQKDGLLPYQDALFRITER